MISRRRGFQSTSFVASGSGQLRAVHWRSRAVGGGGEGREGGGRKRDGMRHVRFSTLSRLLGATGARTCGASGGSRWAMGYVARVVDTSRWSLQRRPSPIEQPASLPTTSIRRSPSSSQPSVARPSRSHCRRRNDVSHRRIVGETVYCNSISLSSLAPTTPSTNLPLTPALSTGNLPALIQIDSPFQSAYNSRRVEQHMRMSVSEASNSVHQGTGERGRAMGGVESRVVR